MPKGKYSFIAGGKQNYSLGTAGHVEGYKNASIGDATHAEGQKTTAGGRYSHSQGLSTTASAECSHAEGYATQCGVPIRSCKLRDLNPYNQTVVIKGVYQDQYEDGNKVIVIYTSNKKRYRAPRKITSLIFDIEKDETSFIISPPLLGQPKNLKVINPIKGKFSHAQGYKTQALGEASTAIGRRISVVGDTSVGIQLNKHLNNVLTQDNTLAIVGGKVGIDTLNPQKTLDVNGTVKIGRVEIEPNGIISGVAKFSENISIVKNIISSDKDLIIDADSLKIASDKIILGVAKPRSKKQYSEAFSFLSERGDAQSSKYFLIKQTSNSNFVTMTFDGSFENLHNIIKISKKCTWFFNVSVVAYNVSNNAQAAFSFRGALGHDGSICKFIGNPLSERFFDDDLQNAKVKLDCTTCNLKVKVAGINNNIIKWHCVVSTNEIYHQ